MKSRLSKSVHTLANIYEAEIARLKARIEQLEEENDHLRGKPITDHVEKRKAREQEQLRYSIKATQEQELRRAVKDAERRVEWAWDRASKDIPEYKAWRAGRGSHPLGAAQCKARAAAREDVRARWAREEAEKAAARPELPAHITRLTSGDVVTGLVLNGKPIKEISRRRRGE